MSFKQSQRANQDGFSLMELMIAVLLLTITSVMIYSILNVGIKFSDQGNKKILEMERRYGLMSLLQRQIKSAVYDVKQKKILMSGDDEIFKVVTRNPYIYQSAGIVLAVYRFNPSENSIYYTEKRDYYNLDYGEDYVPEYSDMIVLAIDEEAFAIKYDGEASPEVTIEYRGEEYSLVSRCADEKALGQLGEEEGL